MTLGDKIRSMTDEELAEMIVNSVAANDYYTEYRVDFGGYLKFTVADADDLAEKLGEIEVDDE